MRDIAAFTPDARTALEATQRNLHEVIKQNLCWMPLLNQLWTALDDALLVLDKLDSAIDLEREREAFKKRSLQRDLIAEQEAQERDAYLRSFAKE